MEWGWKTEDQDGGRPLPEALSGREGEGMALKEVEVGVTAYDGETGTSGVCGTSMSGSEVREGILCMASMEMSEADWRACCGRAGGGGGAGVVAGDTAAAARARTGGTATWAPGRSRAGWDSKPSSQT